MNTEKEPGQSARDEANRIMSMYWTGHNMEREMRDAIATALEAKRGDKPLLCDNLRLLDLVRYMRSELHQQELITDEEYAALCIEVPKGSPRRLEDYDRAKAQFQQERETLAQQLADEQYQAGLSKFQLESQTEVSRQLAQQLEQAVRLSSTIENHVAHSDRCAFQMAAYRSKCSCHKAELSEWLTSPAIAPIVAKVKEQV